MTDLIRREFTSSSHALDKTFQDRACSIDKCDAQAADYVSILLCVNHLRIAWAAYQIVEGTDQAVTAERPYKHVNPRHQEARGNVYFAQVGKYVKIGWSSNVKQRMSTLGASALYVTYPGTRADESKAHRLFHRYLATGREYFYPQPALMDYIKGLQTGSVPTPESVS